MAVATGTAIALAASALGAGADAYGQSKAQKAANKQRDYINSMGQGMMQGGPGSWETMLASMMQGRKDLASIDPNAYDINAAPIMQNFNAGNDALLQFMRSDPLAKMQGADMGRFDTSQMFKGLMDNDQMQIDRAMNATRAGYAGLGQRFGSAAQRGEGRTRADFGAQIGARNAGLAQSSFENAAQRRLGATQAGLGFQFGGAQAQAQQGNVMAQLAAALGQANQQGRMGAGRMNMDINNQNWMQRMQGVQGGFGMEQARRQGNQNLLSLMAGMPSQGNSWGAVGEGLGEFGQLMMLLPFLRQQGGGGGGMPNINMAGINAQLPGINQGINDALKRLGY